MCRLCNMVIILCTLTAVHWVMTEWMNESMKNLYSVLKSLWMYAQSTPLNRELKTKTKPRAKEKRSGRESVRSVQWVSTVKSTVEKTDVYNCCVLCTDYVWCVQSGVNSVQSSVSHAHGRREDETCNFESLTFCLLTLSVWNVFLCLMLVFIMLRVKTKAFYTAEVMWNNVCMEK